MSPMLPPLMLGRRFVACARARRGLCRLHGAGTAGRSPRSRSRAPLRLRRPSWRHLSGWATSAPSRGGSASARGASAAAQRCSARRCIRSPSSRLGDRRTRQRPLLRGRAARRPLQPAPASARLGGPRGGWWSAPRRPRPSSSAWAPRLALHATRTARSGQAQRLPLQGRGRSRPRGPCLLRRRGAAAAPGRWRGSPGDPRRATWTAPLVAWRTAGNRRTGRPCGHPKRPRPCTPWRALPAARRRSPTREELPLTWAVRASRPPRAPCRARGGRQPPRARTRRLTTRRRGPPPLSWPARPPRS